jgi:hypothetical protein
MLNTAANTVSAAKRVAAISASGLAVALLAALVFAAGPARAEFGIATFDQQIASDPAGDTFTQAGGHPYAISTEINLNTHPDPEFFNEERSYADVKDIVAELPPGLFGNPAGIAQCTAAELTGALPGFTVIPMPTCPISSQVGTIEVRTDLYKLVEDSWVFPVYNMVPPSDAPAAFGFNVAGVPITLSGNVRNGGDFGVDVISSDIPITLPITGFTLTFWGVPADPSHDAQRCDWGNLGYYVAEHPREAKCDPGMQGTPWGPNSDPAPPRAFLTVPVSCSAPGVGMQTTAKADSWLNPGAYSEQTLFSHLPPSFPSAPSEWGPQQGVTGCDRVPFDPSVTVEPSNHQADTPAGLNIDFKLPQEGLINPGGIATSDVKKTVVTLPEGVSISPSAAQGLGACSLAQIGLGSGASPTCPDSSKLGTVEIDTPLLETPLEGSIYLARQNENPFNSLVAIYLVAQGHGVTLKLAGKIELDPQTGRVVTTVENSPQLPFDELKVDFNGGPRAPLVNPHTCGTYQTIAQMTPWSGNPPAEITSSFQITSGPEGSPCPPSPQAFAPSFAAGTTNNQAGAYSPLSVLFKRNDGEQQLGGLTMTTPPGLLGSLTGIPLCQEPQAAQGTCSSASRIGHFTVGAGAGANPLYVYTGQVFLTGPYKGGPFGLSIVVPAVAGPFNLGTVVVRASIKLDPVTTALTIAADPLPTILDGIPLDLRVVDVSVDRPNFIINPTDCNPMALGGTLTGDLGASEAVSSSFQVTNCGRLAFAPKFKVSTSGRPSRVNGASLKARITYPSGPQANIAKVKVELPKQLPSRLTTLQKACPDTTFAANPANCPAASLIGRATAVTPVLPVPLSGPAYFVSHGGAAFPDLILVLQGYGVTFDLVGTTFISKTGITSTTFKTVPDVPIGSFELSLPQGPSSALAANGNLCAAHLVMPTVFESQNGITLRQNTPITASGCAKAKRVKHKAGKRRAGKGKTGKGKTGKGKTGGGKAGNGEARGQAKGKSR